MMSSQTSTKTVLQRNFSETASDGNDANSGGVSAATLRPTVSPTLQTTTSRRLRLMGFARATRDTYIPRIATSVTLLASGVNLRSLEIQYDEYGLPLTFPNDTALTLFPSYTRHVTAAESPANTAGYVVSVRGWMRCPGLMSRKNRLVLSLAKQVTKGRTSRAAQNAVDRLNHDSSLVQDPVKDNTLDDFAEAESLASSPSVASSSSSDRASVDQLIKERLSSFIARSIPKAHLHVVVGAADPRQADLLCEKSPFTDMNGHFECDIFTPYEPSAIQVTCLHDDTITCCEEVHIMPNSGYGVISDIDDTVKLTGVIGDKRELLNKILVGSIQTWNIPQVVAWYQEICLKLGATFHYVSNSPWQLFPLINQYFDCVKLPPGSVHLKQYSGNIITSLMEPSSSRKSIALRRLLKDFPNKKFICIGDSGEQDIEAYTDLAKTCPDRIAAIYIRAVPNSFLAIDDARVLKELKWMTSNWEKRQGLKYPKHAPPKVAPDLIDLSESGPSQPNTALERRKRLPPMVPRKPTALKGNTLHKLPPLPERRYVLSNAAHSESSLETVVSLQSQPKGDFAAGSPRDSLRDSPRNSPRDSFKDSSWKSSENFPQDSHKDSPKDSAQDAFKNSPNESVEDSTRKGTASQPKRPSPPPPPPARRRKPPMEDSEYSFSSSSLDALSKKAEENLVATYGINDLFELVDVDNKAAVWIQRVQESLHDLDGTRTRIAFFEDADEDFFTAALENL